MNKKKTFMTNKMSDTQYELKFMNLIKLQIKDMYNNFF